MNMMSYEKRWSKTVALSLMEQDGRNYSTLPYELRCDKDIFLTAVKNGYRPADHVEEIPQPLLSRKGIVMMLLQDKRNIDSVIEIIPYSMLHNKDIAIMLMSSLDEPFKYFSQLPVEFKNANFIEEVLEHSPVLAYKLCLAPLEVQTLIMPEEWMPRWNEIHDIVRRSKLH